MNFIRQMARFGRTQTPQLRACFQTVCHTMELDAHSLSAVADQLVICVIIFVIGQCCEGSVGLLL